MSETSYELEEPPALPDEIEEVDLAPRARFSRTVEQLTQLVFDSRWTFLGFGCCIALSAAAIFWSLFFRLEVFDELVLVELEELALEERLGELRLQLASVDGERLEAEIDSASFRVFSGFPKVAEWLQDIEAMAFREGIELRYRIHQSRVSAVPEVLEVPVELEFKGTGGAADKRFETSMSLIAMLLSERWHLDVTRAQALGDGAGLEEMTVSALIWVEDPHDFAAHDALTASPTDATDMDDYGFESGEELIQ